MYPRDQSVRNVDRTLLRRTSLAQLEREHHERMRTGEARFTLSSKDPNVTFDTRFPLFGPSGEELGYLDQYWENKFLVACCQRWGCTEMPPPSMPLPGIVQVRGSTFLGIEDSNRMSALSARPTYNVPAENIDEDLLTVSAVSASSLYRESNPANPAVLSDVLTAGRSTAFAGGNVVLGSRHHFQYFVPPAQAEAHSEVLRLGTTTTTNSSHPANSLLDSVADAAQGGRTTLMSDVTLRPSVAVDRELRFTHAARQSVVRQSTARPSAALPLFHYPFAVELAPLARPVDGGFEAVDVAAVAEHIEQNLNSQFASFVIDCTDQKVPPLSCNTQVVIAGRQFYVTRSLGNGAFAATATEEGVYVVLYKWASYGAVLGACESTRAVLGHRIMAPSREVYGFAFADGGITVIVTECRALPLGDVLGHPSSRPLATKVLMQALTTLVSRRVIHGSFLPQNLVMCEDGTVVATHWEGAVDFTMFADSMAGCTTLLGFDTRGERHLRGYDADLLASSQWISTIPRSSIAAWDTVFGQLANRPTRWADYIMSLRSVVSSLPKADTAALTEVFAAAGYLD